MQHTNADGQDFAALGAVGSGALASLGQDEELLKEFLSEASDHLQQVETYALDLEQAGDNLESVHALFRSFHTLKGLAGFLEFPRFQAVCHEVESILDLARAGERRLTQPVIDLILRCADFLRVELGPIQNPGQEEAGHSLRFLGLIQELQATMRNEAPTPAKLVQPQVAVPAEPVAATEPPKAPEAASPSAPAPAESGQGRSAESVENSNNGGRPAAAWIKVDTTKLDYLVDMVGEMVIAQSLLKQTVGAVSQQHPQLGRDLGQLARISDEIQRTAMSMRMVPVGQLFQKMARLVRDLSLKSGKPCELQVVGGHTELDRNIVEQLADPVMHMVRNAVDHGLDSVEQRKTRGKSVVGTVTLAASHEAGHILIRISDDGNGLNRDKIIAKAVQKGLISAGTVLSDADAFALIFHPGFSTAETITDVSGRGVGMDVVKRRVQKLRGRIEIESQPGKGTTFVLKLPLTLAIIDGLVVKAAGERYVVPIYAVREMTEYKPEMLRMIENRYRMVLLREEVLPLIVLSERLNLAAPSEPEHGILVVVEVEGRHYGVLTEAVLGKQEVVIKSLGGLFPELDGIAGATILGDGRVGLILDMDSVIGNVHHA